MVFGGGIIPEGDIERLETQGVAKVFGPGTDTHDIIDFLNAEFGEEKD